MSQIVTYNHQNERILFVQDIYAEWVGIGAKIALLEANAICVVYLLTSKADTVQALSDMLPTISLR